MTLSIPATRNDRIAAGTMLVLTLIYLMVELGFNARLLDTVGGTATSEEIDAIERFGRIISGAALTLFVWGNVIRKTLETKEGFFRLLFKLSLSAILCCALMYVVQETIISTIVARSSEDTRSRAAILVPVTHLLTLEDVTMKGLDLTAEQYRTPEGKAFLATFALQALAVPELGTRMSKIGEAVFWRVAEESRGGYDKMYGHYRESVDQLDSQYRNQYLAGVRRYRDVIADSPRQQQYAWNGYVSNLARKRMRPNTVPRYYFGRVRASVQESVPVPNNWHPADQVTFNNAVHKKVVDAAQSAFESEAGGLPPNLSRGEFFAHNRIQEQWNSGLKITPGIRLTPDWTRDEFVSQIEVIIGHDADRLRRERMASPENYRDGARLEKVGLDSVRALVVPPIALAFSLLGAFTHILKTVLWLLKLFVTPTRLVVISAVTLYMSAVLIIPLFLHNQVTTQPLFLKLQTYTIDHMGFEGLPVAAMTRWAVQMQHYFYPINEAVRLRVLGDARFGYQPTN
jgi:hypothetical protein